MSSFDKAWALLKMPVYETGVPGIQFVTQGDDDPHWRSMDNVYGYVPADPSRGQGEIQYITPGEYGKMTSGEEKGGIYIDALGRKSSPREADDNFYQEMMDRAEAGEDIKFGMPYVFSDFDPDIYHEGRHRMAELFARGHGDTPLPVKVMRGTRG